MFSRSMSARGLSLMAMWLALAVCPLLLNADQLWQQPLTMVKAENIIFNGHAIPSPDGSYALTWTAIDAQGNRQVYFQRFNSSNEALSAAPLAVPSTANNSVLKAVRTSNGLYLLLLSGGRVARLDPEGNSLGCVYMDYVYLGINSRVELVPDQAGGAWVSCQYSLNSLRKINRIDDDGGAFTYQWLSLPTVNLSISDMTILPQPDNSAICGYIHNGQLRLLKVTSGLQITMDVFVAADSGMVKESKLFQDAAGDLIWVYYKNSGYYVHSLRALKTNAQGVPLWNQPLDLEDPLINRYPICWDAVATQDGNFLFAFIYQTDSPTALWAYAQRFDSSGNTYLSNRTLQLDPASDSIWEPRLRLLPHNGDNAWMTIHEYNYNNDLSVFNCLYLDASGFDWQDEINIETTYHYMGFGQIGQAAFREGESLVLITHYNGPDTGSIHRREVTSDGEVSAPVSVYESVSALISETTLVPLGANILTSWIQNREPLRNVLKRESICYQMVSPQGQKILPQTAEMLSGGSLRDLAQLQSLALPDGSVMLWWVELGNTPTLRAQLIDQQGNQLWEAGGRLIAQGSNLCTDYAMKASLHEGDIYFAWGGYAAQDIRGQRLVNGAPQWESQGRVLITAANAAYTSPLGIRLHDLKDDCLIYDCGRTEQNSWGSAPCMAVLRFDATGAPLPGFQPGGNQALFYSNGLYKGLIFSSAFLTPAGILISAICWDADYDEIHNEYYYYTRGSSHQLMGYDGIPHWVGQGAWEDAERIVVAADNDGFYSFANNQLRKMDYSGYVIWTENAYYSLYAAVETEPGSFIGLAKPRSYCTFSNLGDLSWPHDHLLANETISSTYLQALDGDAYAAWKIGPHAYYNSYSASTSSILMLQRLTESLTPTDDPCVPSMTSMLSLSTTPNPFRSAVSLQISSKQALQAELTIYNLRGQKLRTLHTGDLPLGASLITWDGRDSSGQSVSAGMYFIRVTSSGLKPILRKLIKF